MSPVIVCLDKDRPASLAEFRSTAKRLASKHGGKLHSGHHHESPTMGAKARPRRVCVG
jgi:hypothetical protein